MTRNFYLPLVSVMTVLSVVVVFAAVQVHAADLPRDCDPNAIIHCGATTKSELLDKYDKNVTGDLKKIYDHYGITRSDISDKTSDVKTGFVYKNGDVVVDGKTVATGAYSIGRENMPGSKRVNIGGNVVVYQRDDTSNFKSNPIQAHVLMRDGRFYRAVLTSCGNPVVATPPPAKPKPIYACKALTATKKSSRTEYEFTASATAENGATIEKYNYVFGDGATQSSKLQKVNHTYAKAGTYTAKLTVDVKVDGVIKTTAPTSSCEVRVIIEEQPATPVYRCDVLQPRTISLADRQYGYTLSYTADGGAKLTSVDYNFGDGQTVNRMPASGVNVEHTYAKEGTYKTVATLHFTVPATGATMVKDVKCETTITISPEMCPTNPSLPKGDAGCAPCEVPGKEHLPKNSPECVTPPVVAPPELPRTGAGEVISSMLGLIGLTTAGYYWYDSRRNLFVK